MGLPAKAFVDTHLAQGLAPRTRMSVSEWADRYVVLSSKGSAEPGQWRTSRNPVLREPMDALSATSTASAVVLKFPIQLGKTSVAINWLGYVMCHAPGPIMVCLPGEISMMKWSAQKLEPALAESPEMRRPLTSIASRETANQKNFKDFAGGQLYLEHAGSPARLKSTTVRYLIVDEVDEFSSALTSGDDPLAMLKGRISAYPGISKELYISTPTIKEASRIDELYEAGSRATYHVPCPDCGHEQPLAWEGLHWNPTLTAVWYVCRECGVCIEEHHKPAMIRSGRWVHADPDSRVRSYTVNGLYYPIGLGPRWRDLAREWIGAQGDPAKLKTFVNDRLAESWEDPAKRAIRQDQLRDRALSYPLRTAPAGALVLTAGVDTQDDRLEVQIVGWGRELRSWTVDYVRIDGDPANDSTWVALTELLNRPIVTESGALLQIQATAIDAGGHRTEYVKHYVRKMLIRRPLAIFGAKPANAPVLSRGKLVDVTVNGQLDKRGVKIHHVGTIAAKNWIYGRIGTDADKAPEDRLMHFSDQLPDAFFPGVVSEVWDPRKGRFVNRRGARNEPLDTLVYAYAAAHHAELRLHHYTRADWDQVEQALAMQRPKTGKESVPAVAKPALAKNPSLRPSRRGLAGDNWSVE